jgi:tagatose 1,6-diphosphate aldolase
MVIMGVLSSGKASGLKAMANSRGVIEAAALDQRGLLQKMIVKAQGGGEASQAQMEEFKQHVTDALTRYASAMLLDVEFGLPATKKTNGKGLLLAYEKSGYDVSGPEKLPSLTEGWSVLRLKEHGATGIKILLYYNPWEKEHFNEQKKAWVERIGAECRALDIPLFCELLAYDVHGEAETGVAYAKRKPAIVNESIKEFTKDRYGADVMKLEAPVIMKNVSGTKAFQGEEAYTREEAMQHFRDQAATTDRPILYLSAGTTPEVFLEMLDLAREAGVKYHGVLCGRATWQNGVPVYVQSGTAALDEWLRTEGAANIQAVNKALEKAHPWYEAKSMQ